MSRKIRALMISFLLALALLLPGCTTSFNEQPEQEVNITETVAEDNNSDTEEASDDASQAMDDIPEYSGEPYIVLNGNVPLFTDNELMTEFYETYSDLDSLGRCGTAMACIGQDLMPTEDRESISEVTPSGWKSVEYDNVDGGWLYNRCHLIGYQLTGENANERNLITGTRYLNIEGMLPFENMVADFVNETGNHVLYRVTPVFEGDNLVSSGVIMEGLSVEDAGESIQFHVYCYNVQPGIGIDYATGDSWEEDQQEADTSQAAADEQTYILNTNTMKFHKPDCSSVSDMSDSNKAEYTGSREELISEGYEPCGRCNP